MLSRWTKKSPWPRFQRLWKCNSLQRCFLGLLSWFGTPCTWSKSRRLLYIFRIRMLPRQHQRGYCKYILRYRISRPCFHVIRILEYNDRIQWIKGPDLEGCNCEDTEFRCCPDDVTAATGPDFAGCGCYATEHKCCPDKSTPAEGPNFHGCPCHTHEYGCCPDGKSIARGPGQVT